MHIDLKFIKSWGAYNAGEIARFITDRAQTLIERGVAIEHSIEQRVEAALGKVNGNAEADPSAPGTQASGSTDAVKPQSKAK